MADRPYVLSTKYLPNLRLGATADEEQRAISQLVRDGLRADQDRQGWLDRQSALTKLRFGQRDPKTFPWPGASNLSIPVIDAQIRRYKPLLMRLVVEADPIVEFVGEDAEAIEAERVAEAEYNWLFRQHMSAIEPLAYVIDAICHRGFGVAQVGWDYQTELETRILDLASLVPPGTPLPDPDTLLQLIIQEYQLDPNDPTIAKTLAGVRKQLEAGQPVVRLALRRTIVDRPALWDRDPVQIIVPPRCVDYGNAEFVIVQHVLPLRKIKQMEADGFFTEGTVAAIQGDMRENGTRGRDDLPMIAGLNAQRIEDDRRERIWGVENEENVLLWEAYHWHDIDGDGLADRVITWVHPRSKTKCSSRAFPYPFHRWPFVKFDFEKTSRRFHSPRGITGLLEHIQRQINSEHNFRLDAMALRNAPIYQMPVLAGFKARNFRAVPGTVIHTPMGARLEPVMQDRGSFPESVNEENILRNLAENYIGNFDTAVAGQSGGASRRTATEVNATVQLSASTASLDAILFQLCMKEVHDMIWQLWMEFRPTEVSYKVQGLDPQNPEARLITVSKADINKKFKLVPTGTIANTNRALELANAREALTYFVNDQTGFINPYELRRWYFTLLDFRRARKVMNSPDQAAYLQTLQQAAAAIQNDPSLATGAGAQAEPPPEQIENTEIVNEPAPTE